MGLRLPFTAALELHRRALLVDGGDEPALADALRHLGELHVDEELLLRAGAGARARAALGPGLGLGLGLGLGRGLGVGLGWG